MPGLFVLSRTAALAYKNTDTDPRQIADRMGVGHLLKGSVRRTGGNVRINAQLIDGKTGGNVWAQRYEGAWDDVLVLQDRVVSEVATALELRLARPQHGSSSGGTASAAAYEAFLKGLELNLSGSATDLPEVVRQFKQAIAIDPSYGHALAELAWVYYTAIGNEERERALGTGTLETIGLAEVSFSEAMKHPSASGYQLAAERHINHWESELAITDLQHAIALDPSDVWNYRQMAKAKILGGRPDEGLAFIDVSLLFDPRERRWTTVLRGLAEFELEHYPEAAALLETTLVGPAPNRYDNLLPLMATYGKLGAADKAKLLRRDLDVYAAAYGDNGVTALLAAQHVPFTELEDAFRFQDGLTKAGIPELPFDFDPASKERLSGDEMRALTYGHTITGRVLTSNAGSRQLMDFKAGVPWAVTIAADGSSVSYVWGDVRNSGGRIHREGNRDCFHFAYEKACAAIFRNPSGTPAEGNEYYWLHHWYLIAFSVSE